MEQLPSFEIAQLGEPRHVSPLADYGFIREDDRILYHAEMRDVKSYLDAGKEPPTFECAGARSRIYFDPREVRAGIVTCGGLCPGLNDVIRAVVLSLWHHYGVREILGFQYGYEGLVGRYWHEPIQLNPEEVEGIRGRGGSILKSSRGPQDIKEMVETLVRLKVNVLFTVGGDGTLKGARAIAEEAARRGHEVAVVGIPKTIDNDILFVERSFGFVTASSEARRAISAAHVEAIGARNGVGLVKLMGRESGFISVYATLASGDVNFCLIPEERFRLEPLLEALEKRLEHRGHAVIVVAEGAGQDLLEESGGADASGNRKLGDIGVYLRDAIRAHFAKINTELNLKYIDPSYTIRSLPAEASDASFCMLLGQNAVHAAMAGKTNVLISSWHGKAIHVPVDAAVTRRQKVDPNSWLWGSVLSSTGQGALD
ncbi:MAG: ATP-dependent 6-phosphofructokinase [Thermoanaerobaculia bacterium]|nr:ATP-dependent 6-phosphofructokinase [Thermoanaerobaculia bacterium]